MMNIVHRALAEPPRSSLRKMSPNTTISNQIQMKNRKNHTMDQNTWPLPNALASTISDIFTNDHLRCTRVIDLTWSLQTSG